MPADQTPAARSTLPLILWGALIVAAGVIAMFAFQTAHLRAENSLLHQQVELTDLQRRSREVEIATQQLLGEAQLRDATSLAGLKVAFLHAASTDTHHTNVCVIWNPAQQRGLLFAEHLAGAPVGKAYHLSVIDTATGQHFSAGSFQSEQATDTSPFLFKTEALPADVANVRFVLSLEATGSAQSTSDALFSSD